MQYYEQYESSQSSRSRLRSEESSSYQRRSRRTYSSFRSKGTPRAGTKSYRAQSQSPPRAYHNGCGGSPTYGDAARERTYSYTKFFDKASSFADKGFGGNFAGTGRVFGEGLSAGSSAYEKRRSRSKSRSRTKTTADGEMIDEIITGEDGVFDGSPQPEDDIDVDLVKPAFALRGLNNKLAAHMDRMKILEEENSFLRKQIDVLTHSDSALGEARRQMEKLIAEKKKLEDQLAAQKNDIEKNKENVAIHIDKLRAVQQQNRELAAKTKNFAKAIELEREESGSKIAKLEDEIKALKRMKYEWSIEEDTLTKENKESTTKIAQLEEEIEEYMKLKMAIDQVEKTVAPRLRHAKEQCDRVMKEKGELEKELSEVEKKSRHTKCAKPTQHILTGVIASESLLKISNITYDALLWKTRNLFNKLDVLLECEYLTLAIGSVDQSSSQIMEWWHSNEFQVTRPAAPPPPYPGVPGVPLSPMSGRRLSLGSSTETKYSQNTRRLSQPAMTRTQSLQSLCEATDEEQLGESKPQVTHHISRLRERLQHGRELFRANRSTSSEPRTNAEGNEKGAENSDDKTGSYFQPTTINESNIQQNRPVQQARPLAPLSKAGHIPKYQQQANNNAAATYNYNREKPGNSSVAHHAVSFREQLKQGRKLKSTQSASSPSQSYDLGQNVSPETTSTSLQESEKAMKHMEAVMQETKGIKNLTDSRKFTGYNLQKETSYQDTQKLHVSVHVAEAIDQSHTRRVKNISDLEQKVKETRTFLDDYEDKLKIKGKEQVHMTVRSSSVKQKLLEIDTLLTTVKGQLGYTGVLESQLRETNKRLEEVNEQVKRLNEEKRNSPLRGNLSLQQHKDDLLQPDRSIKEEGVITTTTSMLGMASSDLAIRDKQNKDIATEEVCSLQQMQNEASVVKLENDELKQIVPELKNILIEVRSENLRLRAQCEKQARDVTAASKAHEERERAWKVLVEDHNLLKEKYDKMSADMENMVKEKEQNESKVQQLCSQLEEMESRNLHLQQQTKNIETVKLNLSTTKELQTDADEILETRSPDNVLSQTSLENSKHLENSIKDADAATGFTSILDSGQECNTHDLDTCENANQLMQSQDGQLQAIEYVDALVTAPNGDKDEMKQENGSQREFLPKELWTRYTTEASTCTRRYALVSVDRGRGGKYPFLSAWIEGPLEETHSIIAKSKRKKSTNVVDKRSGTSGPSLAGPTETDLNTKDADPIRAARSPERQPYPVSNGDIDGHHLDINDLQGTGPGCRRLHILANQSLTPLPEDGYNEYGEQVGDRNSRSRLGQHISRCRQRITRNRNLIRARSTSSLAEVEDGQNIDKPEQRLYVPNRIDENHNRPIHRARSLVSLSEEGYRQEQRNKTTVSYSQNCEQQDRCNSPVFQRLSRSRERVIEHSRRLMRTRSASSLVESDDDQNNDKSEDGIYLIPRPSHSTEVNQNGPIHRAQSLVSLSEANCSHKDQQQVNGKQLGESSPGVTRHISRSRERIQHNRKLMRSRSSSSLAASDDEQNINNLEDTAQPCPHLRDNHSTDFNQNRWHMTSEVDGEHAMAARGYMEEINKLRAQLTELQVENTSLQTITNTMKREDGVVQKEKEELQEENRSLKTLTNQMKREEGLLQKTKDELQKVLTEKKQLQQAHEKMELELTQYRKNAELQNNARSDDSSQQELGKSQLSKMIVSDGFIKRGDDLEREIQETERGKVDLTDVLESKLSEAHTLLNGANERVKKLDEDRTNLLLQCKMQSHQLQQKEDLVRQLEAEISGLKEEAAKATKVPPTVDLEVQDIKTKEVVGERRGLHEMKDKAFTSELETDKLKRIVQELKDSHVKMRSENLSLQSKCEKQTKKVDAMTKTYEEKEQTWKKEIEQLRLQVSEKISDENMVKERQEKKTKDEAYERLKPSEIGLNQTRLELQSPNSTVKDIKNSPANLHSDHIKKMEEERRNFQLQLQQSNDHKTLLQAENTSFKKKT
ncbi:hypothetical protein Bbelb_418340 [Branchiostoma belcheri]|nr:hypothetical protein Bbelb_418340 [Branchiostoma belcheri]